MRVYNLLSTEFAISNIALSRIKISRFDDLNDPYELMPKVTSEQERKAFRNQKKEYNKDRGLLCFSKSWENVVLWGHYGDRHRGIALGFDIPKEDSVKVIYQPDLIEIKYLDPDKQKICPSSFKGIASTKYINWKYENEIRVFIGGLDDKDATAEGGMHFREFSESLILREVILGVDCSTSVDTIKKLLNKLHPDVKVIKARLSDESYEVIPDETSQ